MYSITIINITSGNPREFVRDKLFYLTSNFNHPQGWIFGISYLSAPRKKKTSNFHVSRTFILLEKILLLRIFILQFKPE